MTLPVVVTASRAWIALFPCQAAPISALIPPALQPVTLRGGRGVVAAAVFEHEDTTIGPYSEAWIAFAVRHRPWFSLPIGSMYLERRASDFGYWVHTMACSTKEVRTMQTETWGYPCFAGDLRVTSRRSKVRAEISENDADVFQFDMKRPGAGMPIHFPLRTYSRLGDDIVRTEMSVDAIGHERQWFTSAKLTLQRHERVEPLRMLSIETNNPIEVRWYDSFRTRMEGPSARFKAK